MQILSERLRLLRDKKGVTQLRAARCLNLTNTTLSNYELNVSSPSPETLVSMAVYYNTTTDYLLGNSNNPIREASSDPDISPELIFKICKLPDDRLRVISNLVDMLSR